MHKSQGKISCNKIHSKLNKNAFTDAYKSTRFEHPIVSYLSEKPLPLEKDYKKTKLVGRKAISAVLEDATVLRMWNGNDGKGVKILSRAPQHGTEGKKRD